MEANGVRHERSPASEPLIPRGFRRRVVCSAIYTVQLIPALKTFEALFCEHHGCDKWRFRSLLFRMSLYPHAVPVAMLCGGLRHPFFAPDLALIEWVANAVHMDQVLDEVVDFKNTPENRRWLRHVACIRVSGGRFLRIARQYLPARATSPHVSAQR